MTPFITSATPPVDPLPTGGARPPILDLGRIGLPAPEPVRCMLEGCPYPRTTWGPFRLRWCKVHTEARRNSWWLP